VLVGYRLPLFTLAEQLGNVRRACRLMGVHRSTYDRPKKQVDRWGLEALNVCERRRPRMPNLIGPHLEQRIVAFALAHPGFRPRRISAELAGEKWGGLRISERGVPDLFGLAAGDPCIALLAWRSGCQFELADLVAGHRGPLEGIVLAAGEHVPEEHSLRAVAVAAICWPRRALMGSKNARIGPSCGPPSRPPRRGCAGPARRRPTGAVGTVALGVPRGVCDLVRGHPHS
jgi:hypothetical protein